MRAGVRPVLRAFGCILLSVCLFAPLAVWLYPSPPLSPCERERLARLFVNPDACPPEPGERSAFLAGLVALPASLLASSLVCRRLEERGWLRLPACLIWVLDLGCAALVLAGCWYVLLEEGFFHLRRNLFFRHPGTLLPATALLLANLRWPMGGVDDCTRPRPAPGPPSTPSGATEAGSMTW
jgi:hypothetical protein